MTVPYLVPAILGGILSKSHTNMPGAKVKSQNYFTVWKEF